MKREGTELLDWKVTENIDKQLLMGIFETERRVPKNKVKKLDVSLDAQNYNGLQFAI